MIWNVILLIPTYNNVIIMQKILNTKNSEKGFTLIELLVVIAIIGILSSIVLVSLNTARQKGNDAAVQSNINTIRTQAALDYSSNNNSYGTLSLTTVNVSTSPVTQSGAPGTAVAIFGSTGDSRVALALNQAGKSAADKSVTYGSSTDGQSYVVAAKLSTGKYWCVDSAGHTGVSATIPTGIVCK